MSPDVGFGLSEEGRTERECVNTCVLGEAGGGNPKLHNPDLEDSFHLKKRKKSHIPYSQASYSQTDDEGNRKAGGEGEPRTHPHRGEDAAWQQPHWRERSRPHSSS